MISNQLILDNSKWIIQVPVRKSTEKTLYKIAPGEEAVIGQSFRNSCGKE